MGIKVYGYEICENDEYVVPDDENASEFKMDILLPLQKIQFENFLVSIPNDPYEHLKHIYGDNVPNLPIVDFDRLKRLKKQQNSIDLLKKYTLIFKQLNDNFK